MSHRFFKGDVQRRVGWAVAILLTIWLLTPPAWGDDPDSNEPAPVAGSTEAANLFTRAADAQNAGEWKSAAAHWKRFLHNYADDPLHLEARNYLGVCLLQLQQYQSASQQFARVVASGADAEFAEEAHINLAWCAYSLGFQDGPGHFQEAASIFADYLTKFPKGEMRDQALFHQAECRYLLQQSDEAAEAYERLLRDYPKSNHRPDALYALGAARLEWGDTEAASQLFDQFLDEFPRHQLARDVQLRKAEVLLHEERFVGAEKLLRQLAESDDFASADFASLRLADCLEKRQRGEQAVEVYQDFLGRFENSPLSPDVNLGLGRALLRLDRPGEAVTVLLSLADDPTARGVEAVHWLCQAYLTQGDTNKAAATAESLLATDREGPHREFVRLDHAAAVGSDPARFDEALRILRDVAETAASPMLRAHALVVAAETALLGKDIPAAGAFVEQFEQNFPDHQLTPDVRFVKGICLMHAGDTEAGCRELNQLLQANPAWHKAPVCRLALANGCRKLGRVDEAESLLEDQLQSGAVDLSTRQQSMLQLAEIALDQGDSRRATQLYSQLRTSSSNVKLVAPALYGQAWSSYEAGEFEKARRLYEQLRRAYPRHVLAGRAHYGLALAKHQLGDFTGCVNDLEVYLTQSLSDEERAGACHLQGIGLARMKRLDEATAVWEEIISHHPTYSRTDKVLHQLGLCAIKRGDNDSASRYLSRLIRDYPAWNRSPRVHFQLGILHATEHRHRPAAIAFGKVIEYSQDTQLRASAAARLGTSLWRLRDFERAAAAFHLATLENQDQRAVNKARFWRAESLMMLRRFTEAVSEYRLLRTTGELADSTEVIVLRHGAKCLQATEQWQEAAEWLKQLVVNWSTLPTRANSSLQLAICSLNAGDYESARRYFQLTAETGDDQLAAEALFRLGQLFESRRDWAGALREYQKLIYGFQQHRSTRIDEHQAKAGIAAGHAALRLADATDDRLERDEHRKRARKYLSQVASQFPDSDYATTAKQILAKL